MRYTVFFALLLLVAIGIFQNSRTTEEKQTGCTEVEVELLNKARIYLDSLPSLADVSGDQVLQHRIELGKKLFLDERLSENGTKSCNSCHVLANFGVDNEVTSPGFLNERGVRNTPTVYNAKFALAQFWDGRATDLKEQAKGPIFNKLEMGIPDEATLISRLEKDESYQQLFARAFPDSDEYLSMENLTLAIEAFEERLVTYSRFDDYLKGNTTALNEQEKRGLNAFIDNGCIPCHSGGATGGNMYQGFPQVGKMSDYTGIPNDDQGRYSVTNEHRDKRLFKVPSLRNVAQTAPYFHDGSVKELHQAVRIMARAQLNTALSEEEIDDIVAFLHTLTGELPKI